MPIHVVFVFCVILIKASRWQGTEFESFQWTGLKYSYNHKYTDLALSVPIELHTCIMLE